MPDAAATLLIDPLGRPQPVAPEEVAGALSSGYGQPTPEQVQSFDAQQKYGGTGSQIATGLTGAGDVLTFGGASALRRATGTAPEQLRGEEEANPTARLAGELSGFAASAFVPGLGEASAPGLIARMGAGVAEHVAPALVTKALTGGAGLAAKALRGGVALGAEGAAYGAQQVVHEAVLGDPALTAESAVATVLGSALAGGALGGGAGVLGHLVGGVSTTGFGDRVSAMAKEVEGFSNLNATNAMPAEIKAIIRNKGDATAIGREGRDLKILINPMVDSPESILERATAVAKQSGEQIDALAGKAAGAGAPVTNFTTVRQQVELPIVTALRKQGATFALADDFSARMDQYAKAYAGRDLDLPGVLGLKRDLGQFIYTNKSTFDVWAREINTPLSRAMGHVSGLVESGVESALGKDALKELLAANRAAEVAITFKTLAESGISRTAANNPIHLSGMMGAVAGASALGHPAGLALGIASEAVRRRGASAAGYVARGVQGILEPSAVAIGALAKNNKAVQGAISAAAAAAVNGTSEAVGNSLSRDPHALYTGRVESVRAAAQPEAMMRAISEHTQGMHDHAPQTAQQYALAHTRAVQYLASQIPQPVDQGILAPKHEPSKAAVRDFNARYEAAIDPVSVIHAAAAGQATPSQIATLATVYPALHKAAAAAALGHIAKLGPQNVPRSQHGPLSLITGEYAGKHLNASVMGPAVLRNQAAFAAAPPPAGAIKPTSKGASAIHVSDRAMTPSQRSASRR